MNFVEILNGIENEKGIPKDVIIEKIERALAAAGKRHLGVNHFTVANFDPETGGVQVFTHREIVEEVEDFSTQISLEQAHKISDKYNIGDFVDVMVDPAEFGRIAAQTARQVVMQGLREAERKALFSEFEGKQGEIVNGIVNRIDRPNVIVEIGKLEAILPPAEQIPTEAYKPGDRIKVYVVDVTSTRQGAQLYISRSHPGFIEKLFEREIPEIADGTIDIKAIAREAGSRSKVAVISNDPNVDPRGACIGANGVRVKNIVSEVNGEKADIVKYSEDAAEFVSEALSPASVTNIWVNNAEKICTVIVPDSQLSLAIGKEGQNARLAAKLTGYKIDIKSETYIAEH
ncbi:MAG: transcription termination factor NusA [Clostridiales bacterium]|jgi:N utilization substance protein A|nr:transcription termination factor NusA [Clostridiales bacterium]